MTFLPLHDKVVCFQIFQVLLYFVNFKCLTRDGTFEANIVQNQNKIRVDEEPESKMITCVFDS